MGKSVFTPVSTAPWMCMRSGEIIGFKNGIEEKICDIKIGLSYSLESVKLITAVPEMVEVMSIVRDLVRLLEFIPTGYLTRREMRSVARVHKSILSSYSDLIERHGDTLFNL